MNKELISNYIMKKVDEQVIDEETQEILKCINETKIEMECARAMFNYVSDPKLIEAAIYKEGAAVKRYEYLIALAKKREITKNVE